MGGFQVTADHIGAMHAYLSEISVQLTDIGDYVWNNVALTDAYGNGLLSPLRAYIRDGACRPFNDGLSEARTSLGLSRYELWAAGAEYDMVDGQMSTYYQDTEGFQDK